MKNLNIRKYYTVGYTGNDKVRQVIDFIITTLLAGTIVSIFLLVIISHIVGGE